MPPVDLFAPTLPEREQAAATFTVFPDASEAPHAWKIEWNKLLEGRDPRTGDPWPDEIAQYCHQNGWPQHAFGTANAAVLLLWNRPRKGDTVHSRETPHWMD
ncbi:MAG: hypothetical protein ACRDKJ_00005, partial [Actinomycetota bacterium]